MEHSIGTVTNISNDGSSARPAAVEQKKVKVHINYPEDYKGVQIFKQGEIRHDIAEETAAVWVKNGIGKIVTDEEAAEILQKAKESAEEPAKEDKTPAADNAADAGSSDANTTTDAGNSSANASAEKTNENAGGSSASNDSTEGDKNIPYSRWNKAQLATELTKREISFDPGATNKVLAGLLEDADAKAGKE